MTIKDLIDYLAQFPPETIVVLSESDIQEPPEDGETIDFIALDTIAYN